MAWCAEKSLLLKSPSAAVTVRVFKDGNNGFFYSVSLNNRMLIKPSLLGLSIAGKPLLDLAALPELLSSSTVTESFSLLRYNNHPRSVAYKKYQIGIGKNRIELAVFNNGCAIRYQLPSGQVQVTAEQTSFVLDGGVRAWFFERNNSWKLKSYAGLWMQTRVDSLDRISVTGPIQGKPIVAQLADKSYLFITEAALQHYSGMRLKANKNTLSVDFTEGDQGFLVQSAKGTFTPWRIIGLAANLNELANQKLVEALNEKPDPELFANTDYIRPGKSAWSWITRGEDYLEPTTEKNIIDAAAQLNYSYTLIDDGWEDKWKQKWQTLKELIDYGQKKNIKVWVWKDSKFLRDTAYCNAFLDTLNRLGVAGIKIDFMNSEAKELIDFEIGFLKMAAKKKLMVNFHGCHTSTGEYRSFPNEMTREGIRGAELNIMNEPIPAWHNAALPFTRYITGPADYTPALFSKRAATTLTHQLALLYLFDSPFQCIAENPITLLKDPVYKPILPLIKDLPTTWDRTIVLEGSEIGSRAVIAKKKGEDWYIAAINGGASVASIELDLSFIKGLSNYKATVIQDAITGFTSSTTLPKKISIPPMGGFVIRLQLIKQQNTFTIVSKGETYSFKPDFVIIYNEKDPEIALKPSGLKKVSYNIPTWKTTDSRLADYNQQAVKASVAGDGFDDKILRSAQQNRTANIYHAGTTYFLTAVKAVSKGDSISYTFPEHPLFTLTAWLIKSSSPYPKIKFLFTPKKDGFYSVGYIGAPSFKSENVQELWQPLIWTEKRTPPQPFLTPSFMATIPATLVNDGNNSIGVLADAKYLPFQPLPLFTNSQFGVALLNQKSLLQPQIFAPMPGGINSQMAAGHSFEFAMNLVVDSANLTKTYEKIATKVFGFKDYRTNATVSMNTTLSNLIDYSKTHYAWFIDSLKGFAYSTDVPGAVKNVSSLNPLELSIIMDDKEMFDKRAYPLMEFMLSREKFLFAIDSTQKIQSPSRKLRGPIAPLSELQVLYNVFGKNNSFYVAMAKKEFGTARIRNLDDVQKGTNWVNAMYMFKLTSDSSYLRLSITLADKYLKERVDTRITQFGDPFFSSNFFWPTFTNNWSALLELYELTGQSRYLQAAQDGARHYTLFTWMAPQIPDAQVTVNKGGKAPMYWYLKSKGHQQMYYPEETVPAWRLSEIGLTPESSGTSTGHRGIFMSTYAPWLLRIGYHTKDPYLMNVAKASIVGRSESFPGYHMNTERTTAYEKAGFPLHEHKAQSVNSFHYNHILPMASMFVDYLVSDAYVKSDGKINFPSDYIEGYAYLQNKFYGAQNGRFFEFQDARLWMPSRLLQINDRALNYISAKKGDTLLLAFMNQSAVAVNTKVSVDRSRVRFSGNSAIRNVSTSGKPTLLKDGIFQLHVPAGGMAAVVITGVNIPSSFQDQILQVQKDHRSDEASIREGDTKALLFKLGAYAQKLFVFLQEDDTKWKKASINYTIEGKKEMRIDKNEYPFEFTVPIEMDKPVRFYLELTDINGKLVRTKITELGK
ncbi:MAG: glycoside hydrolase family 97 catalytic domain-containing protein [Bacteroidota bacterium]